MKLLGHDDAKPYYVRRKHVVVPDWMVDIITNGHLSRAGSLLADEEWRQKMVGRGGDQYDNTETLGQVYGATYACVVVRHH